MEFPSLGEGLGPIVRTKDGGFLRSMNSSLFRNSKNGGNLIMQVSAPVVLPVAMGSSIMEILQHWASVGFEKMSMQAKKLMPLEDITGKMMRQVAWEVASRLDVPERLPFLQQESEIGQDTVGMRRKVEKFSFDQDCDDLSSTSICDEVDLDYGSLEDIVLSAMDKIEALSIEGLRIQCGMSDEKAPSNNGDGVDELMSLSITLKEWMRLDAGVFGDEDEICEKTSKILAAHRAKYTDLISRRLTRDSNWQKLSCRNCGYMGNNFTVALMVQLRDPLRDYESVGAPMLGLIQWWVEEISIEEKEEKRIKECGIPQFKITEVHVAGLNSESGKKQLWGTRTQHQSGARWLLASHMSKTNKHPYLKSNGVVKSSLQVMRKVQHGDTLWSISSYVHGTRAKWKEMAALNLHVRNPDVIF
ncbi:hypothetical protein F0562_009753 [Nyssa sinensis]|uniref:LysM domain-containing protein n=1 Tax=Nyssa sinensis TaxID=561372 RepID=A0A5J4ZYG8_9ASTE|nr:hypothetical protein F0562_009753 [Nyssa sinensis]